MPVTLAQASMSAADDIQAGVIDEFRKSSWLLDNLTFDDIVNPAGGGATLTFGYDRLVTQATAAFRAVNAEYTPQEATKQRVTGELKVFGGSFQIDRLLANLGPAAANEVTLQMQQKIKAAQALFNDAVINGDSGTDANSFDGLDVALTDSSTELDGTAYNWSAGTISSEALAHGAIDELEAWLGLLNGPATAILSNRFGIARFRSIARRAGYFTRDPNQFGQNIERYGNTVLVDVGEKPGTNDLVIPVTAGRTDFYAVSLGLTGFHAVALNGVPLVQTWLPDFTRAGAVKTGEVEMVAAVALKATKAAAVLRNVAI